MCVCWGGVVGPLGQASLGRRPEWGGGAVGKSIPMEGIAMQRPWGSTAPEVWEEQQCE